MYLIHCTSKNNLEQIISDKIIKTGQELEIQGMGKGDIVYFSFYYKAKNTSLIDTKFDNDEYCVIFTIKDIIKRYRYYYVSSNYSYGRIYANGRVSSRLYKMIQLSNDVEDLRTKILDDIRMSPQCKDSLNDDEKLHDLFRFKNASNPSMRDIYNTCGNLWEIGFFENIDFNDVKYKIIKNVGIDHLVKQC